MKEVTIKANKTVPFDLAVEVIMGTNGFIRITKINEEFCTIIAEFESPSCLGPLWKNVMFDCVTTPGLSYLGIY